MQNASDSVLLCVILYLLCLPFLEKGAWLVKPRVFMRVTSYYGHTSSLR